MKRYVTPEILDSLPADDPRALRSRRDLRLINGLMGNFKWVEKTLLSLSLPSGERVVEVGAGEGILCRRLARHFFIMGMDLIPPPEELPSNVEWNQGDFFDSLPTCPAQTLVGVMILHHFSDEKLQKLGGQFGRLRRICICEPYRAAHVLGFGRLLTPVINDVTRHDMAVSIRAGFRPGELSKGLGLQDSEWAVREYCDWRGSVRLLALRR